MSKNCGLAAVCVPIKTNDVIASVAFRNFKALRNTSLSLAPLNLVVGPNGSGKTSLIQAILRLRALAKHPTHETRSGFKLSDGPEIVFRFMPPFAEIEARLGCIADYVCDALEVSTPTPAIWAEAKTALETVRSYLFDHYAIAEPCSADQGHELAGNARNLSAVLLQWQTSHPDVFAQVEREFCHLWPEFSGLLMRKDVGQVQLGATLLGEARPVSAENLSQGMLYSLALLVLVFAPSPPAVVCIEEVDRGIHPRMMRQVQDALYRLSYPRAAGLERTPVQVIATTHSPYLLDQFRDYPEEVVIAQKTGQEARFERLSDRADLAELLAEGSLGDMWYAGILGGVPDEPKRPTP